MLLTYAEPLAQTARRSSQLIAASERTTLDPFREVDWDTPIDDSAYHLPPQWLPQPPLQPPLPPRRTTTPPWLGWPS